MPVFGAAKPIARSATRAVAFATRTWVKWAREIRLPTASADSATWAGCSAKRMCGPATRNVDVLERGRGKAQLAGGEGVAVPVPLERPDQRPMDLGASIQAEEDHRAAVTPRPSHAAPWPPLAPDPPPSSP